MADDADFPAPGATVRGEFISRYSIVLGAGSVRALEVTPGALVIAPLTGGGAALTFHADGTVEVGAGLKPDEAARAVITVIQELWARVAPVRSLSIGGGDAEA